MDLMCAATGGPEEKFAVSLRHGITSVAFGRRGLLDRRVARARLVPRRQRSGEDALTSPVDRAPRCLGGRHGAQTPPLQYPLSSATVSERSQAPGTTLSDYATAIRCVDRRSGQVLAQDIGTETTIQFARPHNVLCRTVNVLAPAVELREATNPASDSGRFDLLVDGRVVASGADGTVAGPVGVRDGRVTVSEPLSGGTRLHDYDSSIQCRSRAGLGPVIATKDRSAASFQISGRQIVACSGRGEGGVCVEVPRSSACQVPRLLPGRSVELQLQVTAHQRPLPPGDTTTATAAPVLSANPPESRHARA